MRGSRRADTRPLPVAGNEKDLSTPQPSPQTDARIPGADGYARRTKRIKAPPRQGTSAPGHSDPSQAARLEESRTAGGLGRTDRLRKSAEFAVLQRRGVRSQSEHFVVYGLQHDEVGRSRLGITVSRRVGGAVVRNRLKRHIRECFRLRLRPTLPAGAVMVVIARQGAGDLKADAINLELGAASADLIRKLHPKGWA